MMKNIVCLILFVFLLNCTNSYSQSITSIQSNGKIEEISERKLNYPFIWGAQYYRAPTPSRENWDSDLKRMSELGFTDVKFWLQWRWAHVAPDKYYFDDLDELMDIAEKYNLRETINVICNVAPIWLYKKYPDAKQITNDGDVKESESIVCRQIGGYPGPCLSNPGALKERQKFLKEAILHLKKHKNLAFWDVWSEPAYSWLKDVRDVSKLRCYCPDCKKSFTGWLKEKYTSIEKLNAVWGRNYSNWDELELPKTTETIKDFVDWCDFHSYVMVKEAKWRLEMTKELDPKRISYLHITPNTATSFNSVTTCMNDFEVAKLCDVFAASMNSGQRAIQMLSAGEGKVCYAAENAINGGSIVYPQPVITLNDLLTDLLPQIGMGIKGFLFWQYRPEVLGTEAPAWGLVNTDGSDRVVTKAVDSFWKSIKPYTELLIKSSAGKPDVAIWKSEKNEVFHYCAFGNFKSYNYG
jgi:beta-galactosidase